MVYKVGYFHVCEAEKGRDARGRDEGRRGSRGSNILTPPLWLNMMGSASSLSWWDCGKDRLCDNCVTFVSGPPPEALRLTKGIGESADTA